MSKQSKQIGEKLKSYRELAKKQLEDTADAVELEANKLVQIEAGEVDLDEEILALLISHYKLDEKQAVELWTMAGYETMELDDFANEDEKEGISMKDKKEFRINIPADVKVLYSDMAQVMSNDYGIVINIIQSAPGNNAMVVSRVGMSKEHAQTFVDMLQKNIDKSD